MNGRPALLLMSFFFEVKDARVKVVAPFGMAFLRNKNGAAGELLLKPLTHPLRICGWSALRVIEC